VCNNYLSMLTLLVVATLASLPVASATTVTDDAPNGAIKAGIEGVGALPLAKCSAGLAFDSSESLHWDLAACLDSTIGPSMNSLLAMLGYINPSTQLPTGLLNGTMTGGTLVLGPLCGTSQACFSQSTPVSTSTVSEPGTLALLGPGLVGLIGFAHRRRLCNRF